MNEKYYLKIGGVEVFDDKWMDYLDSNDDGVKKKANPNLSERLKQPRVRAGTLLKTDNVSFLIGA